MNIKSYDYSTSGYAVKDGVFYHVRTMILNKRVFYKVSTDGKNYRDIFFGIDRYIPIRNIFGDSLDNPNARRNFLVPHMSDLDMPEERKTIEVENTLVAYGDSMATIVYDTQEHVYGSSDGSIGSDSECPCCSNFSLSRWEDWPSEENLLQWTCWNCQWSGRVHFKPRTIEIADSNAIAVEGRTYHFSHMMWSPATGWYYGHYVMPGSGCEWIEWHHHSFFGADT